MSDPLRDLPGYVLRRASSAMMSEFAERLSPLGLRHVEATMLLVLRQQPGLSQSALGRLLGIKRANMTPIAARLEGRGLIHRSASDGRTFGLDLTESGAALAAQVSEVVDAHEAAIVARIPAEHRPHLLPALLSLWNDDET